MLLDSNISRHPGMDIAFDGNHHLGLVKRLFGFHSLHRLSKIESFVDLRTSVDIVKNTVRISNDDFLPRLNTQNVRIVHTSMLLEDCWSCWRGEFFVAQPAFHENVDI